MEILQFKDQKCTPDIIHPYPPTLRSTSTPLIIDNGSYQCRVGWASSREPLLLFKNLIAKPRKERSKKESIESVQAPQLQVGNDITNIEAVRFQLKTQFDRNVVTHFEAQEHLLDYTFTHLGIDTENSIQHPIVVTEAVLNPNSSRQLMSELLFEGYGVPGVAYGIDCLFSYRFHEENPQPDALIISLGYHTCHIVPVLGSKTILENARRINTGGFNIISFLHRILQLKYPAHATSVTLSRAEELLHSICAVALDYREELNNWTDPDYYEANIRRIQLPYNATLAASALTPLAALAKMIIDFVARTFYIHKLPGPPRRDLIFGNLIQLGRDRVEQQKERKRELARRLTEINARKREERLIEDEEKLGQLLYIQEMVEAGVDPDEVDAACAEYQIKNLQDLQKNIANLNLKIEKTKLKISAANAVDEEEPPSKQVKVHKMVFENEKAMHSYVQNAKKLRQDILSKKLSRKQRKQDMAKRRTAAGQERMRIISQLARKEKGNDDFGLRDEDWDIYKTISKDGGDSDSEGENEKLLELEEVIRTHEPSELDESANPGETHQLHVGIERFRAPELIFKPYMMGSSEAGLSEVIGYVLSLFSPDNQLKLAANMVIVGSLANLPGLQQRILSDLISIRPFQSIVNVKIIKNPSLGAWHGARAFSRSPHFKGALLTKKMYEESGSEYFKTHLASNLYFPTPKGQEIEID